MRNTSWPRPQDRPMPIRRNRSRSTRSCYGSAAGGSQNQGCCARSDELSTILSCGVFELILAQMTIQLPPCADPYPLFQVNDLAQDPRFSQLPFVKEGPQFRFYAGTPLTTKKGINIGSFCVMDIESRNGLSADHGHVLGWLAKLVMTQLEISREAMEGKRAKLMSSGLNVFVDGRSRMKNSSGGYPEAESSQRNRQPRDRNFPKHPNRTFNGDGKLDRATAPRGSSAASRDGNSSDAESDSEKRRHSTKERTTTSSDPSSDEEDFGLRHVEAVSDRHKVTF